MSRRFLECDEDNFLTQAIDSPREEALLDLMFTSRNELIREDKTGVHLSCSGYSGIQSLEECGPDEG